MTNNDELAFTAKAALKAGQGSKEMVEFRVTANPANILALLADRDADKIQLDELESKLSQNESWSLAAQKYIDYLESQANQLVSEIDADKKRIAELEALTAEQDKRLVSYAAIATKNASEARTVSVKLPDGWHFEECETEGCQNGAIFSVGKAANNLHLCEACTKEPVYARFTKTALPKRLPFSIAAGIKLEVGE